MDPTPGRWRIVIIGDCAVYREALAMNLCTMGISDVRVAWDLASVLSVLDGFEPEAILVDVGIGNLQSILRAMASQTRHVPLIAIGASADDDDAVIACAEAGVAAYHMRSENFTTLLRRIDDVATGGISCPAEISAALLRRVARAATNWSPILKQPVLTKREAQILELLELGHSNQAIADDLAIAVHTVKNHVHSLFAKLGVSTRAEAAARAHAVRTGHLWP